MPTVRLSKETMNLVRAQARSGHRFASLATERDDGTWEVPVDDEVAHTIAMARLPGESDDDVVSRLVRATLGIRPD